jgi:hypothetical protein
MNQPNLSPHLFLVPLKRGLFLGIGCRQTENGSFRFHCTCKVSRKTNRCVYMKIYTTVRGRTSAYGMVCAASRLTRLHWQAWNIAGGSSFAFPQWADAPLKDIQQRIKPGFSG